MWFLTSLVRFENEHQWITHAGAKEMHSSGWTRMHRPDSINASQLHFLNPYVIGIFPRNWINKNNMKNIGKGKTTKPAITNRLHYSNIIDQMGTTSWYFFLVTIPRGGFQLSARKPIAVTYRNPSRSQAGAEGATPVTKGGVLGTSLAPNCHAAKNFKVIYHGYVINLPKLCRLIKVFVIY